MDERAKQIDQLITKWYKTFGIDHVFYNFDYTTEPVEKQEKPVITKKVDNHLNFLTIDELKNAVLNIDCNLKKSARNTVFSDGNPKSDIMIIGEAPGQDEDEQGKPFVGQSGQLLNNMLLSVGLKRSDVYISNIVFWRPPGNRAPSSDEISLCMPYVENHITLVQPKVLLLLGGVSVKSILNTNEPISKLRGQKNSYLGIETIATFHPAYLLRSPGQKAAAFKDFILLSKTINK